MHHYLTIIRDIFPGQIYLTPREVARVLYGPGRDTKKRTEQVRKQLDDGTLIPGLCKAPGQKRWQVSVVELARALEREEYQCSGDYIVRPHVQLGNRKSRFKNPGMRLVR